MVKRRQHPTDGGWAWVVLVASLGSHILNGALAYSVGILHTGLLHAFRSDSVTMVAMTGAVNSALMCIAAPLAGYIINRFGCRTCCVLGGLLCFAGYTSSSFVTSVILLFFTFGIVAGTGLGLTYSATNITIGYYFHRLRGVASGISNSFGAVGILLGSVVFQALIDTYGVHGTFLLLGAASLHYCFFGMFFRPSIYEGNTTTVPASEEQGTGLLENQTTNPDNTVELDMGPSSHTSQYNEASKSGEIVEERESLLKQNNDCQVEFHSYITPCASDELTTNATETHGVSAESVNSENGNRARETSDDVITTTPPLAKKTFTETRDTVHADDTLPTVTENGQYEEENTEPVYKTFPDAASHPSSLIRPRNGHRQTENDVYGKDDLAITTVSKSDNQQQTETKTLDTTDLTLSRLSCNQEQTETNNFNTVDLPLTREPQSTSTCIRSDISCQDQQCEGDFQNTTVNLQQESETSSPACSRDEQKRSNSSRQKQQRRWGYCGSYRGLLSDPAFMLYCASLFVSNVHISGVFLHLPEYVQHHGTSPVKAAELFLAVGCMSLVSKLSSGFAQADPDIDPLILSIGMMGLNGLVTCLFPLYVDTYVKQMVFSTLFGLYFGGLYALSNPILVRFAGVSRLADAYGISMFILGLGYLMGPTLAAMIVDAGGTYGHSFLFLGLMTLCAAFLDMAAACFLQSRDKTEEARQNAGLVKGE